VANYAKEFNLLYQPLHKKYRSYIEIIGLMLEAIKYNGATRYSLMKHTSINYVQLEKYIESLTEIGFVEVDIGEGQVLYRASEKGLAFLRQYNVLREILLSACTRNKSINVICEVERKASKGPQHYMIPFKTQFVNR